MTQDAVLDRRSFADKPTLAKELAESVADRIRNAIETRGAAAIAAARSDAGGDILDGLADRHIELLLAGALRGLGGQLGTAKGTMGTSRQ